MREWYREQDPAIRADFAGILLQLEGNHRARNNKEIFKRLEKHNSSKSCEGFHELRVIYNHEQHRIIGHLEDDTFTMLVPFPKTDGIKYKYPCDQAAIRKEEIDNDRRRSKDWEFPPDED
jgi:hypothetical protein